MMTAALLTLGLIAASGSSPAEDASQESPTPQEAQETQEAQDTQESQQTSDAAVAPEDLTFEQRCAREVEELHQFFHDWFVGELPDTDEAYGRFADVIHEDFVIIQPSGRTSDRDDLMTRLREAHGSASEAGVKIWILGFEVRQRLGSDMAVVTYEEWQDRGSQKMGRVSTAILREAEGTPNGVEWLHLHETWLPR